MIEIKQINEIINKLDIIQEDEWQIKEGETEEEYNERIEEIEEELEEELLDYISDSLLDEQKINEEDARKEAQEKIKKDYELFEDAFIKKDDGTITLKSDEELVELGYDSPDELEKLRDIEKNMNNSDQYLNAIRESIKASKDIDAEIDRKMEFAKSIITAKKRGESLPSSLNSNLQKDKFEKANEYVASTTTLKRIPVIQNEYIKNNYIAERRYNNLIRNNNVNRGNTSNNRVVTSTATVNSTPVINNVVSTANIVTKKIPDRKNVVYSNFEKKLDKDNDLTKQKIKARTELKLIFKEIENKELLGEEVEKFNSKIENIRKKYLNIVDEELIEKISKRFNFKLEKTTKELEIQSEIKKESEQHTENQVIKEILPKQQEKSEDVTPKFDERRKEILNILSDFNENNENVFGMPENYMFFIPTYLSKNDDEYVRNGYCEMLSKLESGLQDEFIKNMNDKGIDLNIALLDYLYQLYSSDGKGVVIPNREKAIGFLHKELNYFNELRNKAYSSNNNSIESIKNEAKFCDALIKLRKSELAKGIPVMPLMITHELTKRNSDTTKITKMISSYKEKIQKNSSLSENELNELGRIAYEGITDLSGNVILEPNKVLAKDIYTKLITDYKDKNVETNYNRLYTLYADQTLPIYDEGKANNLKKVMKQKKITIKKEEKNKEKKASSVHTYVCSDLHGQYPVYKAIINKLKGNDKLYILGDVIDRGPDGIKILQDIMKRKEKGQVEFLVGNHEVMMMQSLFLNDKKERENWEGRNVGKITREAFQRLNLDEQNKIKEFILDSYVYKNINVNSQNIHLVHAKSIQDKNDNSDKTVRQMLEEGKEKLMQEAVWKRDSDSGLFAKPHPKSAKPGTFTIIGHTPTKSNLIEYKDGYIDIDCGAGYLENASLVDLQDGTVEYFDIHRERMKEEKER